MASLWKRMVEAFDAEGWAYAPVEGREVLEADFEATHSKIHLHVQAFDQTRIVSVVAHCSQRVPTTHRAAACELLMRTNEQLVIGNFELHWERGEIYFRLGNLFESLEGDRAILTGMVRTAIAEVDHLTPFVGVLVRTSAELLEDLEIRALLQRSDLHPTGESS